MTPARPLGLVVLSSDYVRVHFALMMAAAAASVDRPVTVFVTMGAVPLVLRDAGWRQLDGSSRNDDMTTRGIADLETLLDACRALDVSFVVCETGLLSAGESEGRLRTDLALEVAGLVTFFGAVGDGEIATI